MKKVREKIGCCGIIMVVTIVLGMLMLVMAAYGSAGVLERIDRVKDKAPTVSEEKLQNMEAQTDAPEELPDGITVVDEDDILAPVGDAEPIKRQDHIINLLLIGVDRREEESSARSDTMILCTINTKKKTMVM